MINKNILQKKKIRMSPGLVIMGDDSCSRGRRFESRRRILDGNDIFHVDLLRKLNCLLEKSINKRKRGLGWPIQKERVCLIGIFIVLWTTFQSLWQQFFAQITHILGNFVKLSKYFILLVKSFLGNF